MPSATSFEETLIQAYLRTNRGAKAAAILRRRLERRPWKDRDWLARAEGAGVA